MIQTSHLQKSFKKEVALKEATINIEAGEFVAIVGPSGSGKSTLLQLIGGLDKPTKGQITVDNQKISRKNDNELSTYRNQKIGFIFQEFHLEQNLTVLENILLPTYFGKHKTYNPDELLTEVELLNKKNNKVKTLSGGQKQRVAIARAFINQPKIILADEPTGNLDEKTGQKIIKLLKKIHKKHRTTFLIATHDLNIAKVADRIIRIKDGKCS